jgi:hypothetical protein
MFLEHGMEEMPGREVAALPLARRSIPPHWIVLCHIHERLIGCLDYFILLRNRDVSANVAASGGRMPSRRDCLLQLLCLLLAPLPLAAAEEQVCLCDETRAPLTTETGEPLGY